MFISLKRLIKRMRGQEKANLQTYDLTDADIAALRRLRSSDDYDVLLTLIDNMSAYHAEAMLSCHANVQVHFLRGQLAALRGLPIVIERMSKAQEDAAERNADTSNSIASRREAARAASLYATPGWPS